MAHMSDKIIERSEYVIIYLSSDMGPPVPYPAMERPNTPDRPNLGFIDCRDNPDAAEAIFEAQDVPRLRALLRAVNAVGSPFMSLGCERNLNVLDPPVGEAIYYLNSYLEVTAKFPKQQTEDAMISLARSISTLTNLTREDCARLELGVELMKHFFGQQGGHCLHIGISGYGRTHDEARIMHEKAGKIVAEAFSNLIAETTNSVS